MTHTSTGPGRVRESRRAQRRRARADLNAVLAITGSAQLSKNADVRVAGRQVRAKAHTALYRDRGERCTVSREAAEGAYAQLPVWSHRDQWLLLVEMAVRVWFPELLHRQVGKATLLKFAVRVAANADDETGRDCRGVYAELACDMAMTVETVRKCWRALERMGLAVQVERSVVFSFNERMRLWRLSRSKQRGYTPEYALVVPAAYAQALVTGEHPADLLARDPAYDLVDDQVEATSSTADGPEADPAPPAERLRAALAALRRVDSTGCTGALPALETPAELLPVATAGAPADEPPSPPEVRPVAAAVTAVDNRRRSPFGKLENVDILGLPRSGPRPAFRSCLSLVTSVPLGEKSTASRAHNRRPAETCRPGQPPQSGAQRHQAGRGGWFGPHRDIAVYLTRRMLFLRPLRAEPGRIAMHFKRFTAPGLPKPWRPADFVDAFEAIYRRQGRCSPGANMASSAKVDQAHAAGAAAGAVRSPIALLKWHLEQLDPVNDHPRFELDRASETYRGQWLARRQAVEAEKQRLAEIGMERGSERRAAVRTEQAALARELMGTPPSTSLRNRR